MSKQILGKQWTIKIDAPWSTGRTTGFYVTDENHPIVAGALLTVSVRYIEKFPVYVVHPLDEPTFIFWMNSWDIDLEKWPE